jgi:hypothetical protein
MAKNGTVQGASVMRTVQLIKELSVLLPVL